MEFKRENKSDLLLSTLSFVWLFLATYVLRPVVGWSDDLQVLLIFLTVGWFVYFSFSALMKTLDPMMMRITDEGIYLKSYWFKEAIWIDLEDIQLIVYKVYTKNIDMTDSREERIYFVNRNGELLANVNLNKLAGTQFMEIYEVIVDLALHIEWKIPS